MRKYWPVLLVLAAALLFVGNFHVFTGAGLKIVPRVTFSLAEFLVNEEALRSMAPVVLATQYPLAAMALKADDERDIEKARAIVNK